MVSALHVIPPLLLIGAAAWLGPSVYLYARQRDIVYQPSAELIATPAERGLAYEELWLDSTGGVRLHGWYVAGPTADAPVVLFLHGNAGNISHRLDSLALFHELGLASLIVDYRGYGRSSGTPDEAGTYADAHAAWDHLVTDRGIERTRIAVLGRSLGGPIAAWLAARVRPAALVLESTFTSLPAAAAARYPWLPVRWLTRMHYATRDHLCRVRCPVLVVHSRDDEVIPFHHGEVLFRAAPEPRTLLILEGGHADAQLVSQARYRSGLGEFLHRHLPA